MNTEKVWLEMTLPYDADGDVGRPVLWQWRGGRCVKNGASTNVEEAIMDAEDAREAFNASQEVSA